MYKKRTSLLGIPYMSKGEKLTEQNEKEKAQLFENLLFAGINGLAKALFEDGNYVVEKKADGTCSVRIVPEEKYSLLGIVNYSLFMDTKEVVFENMQKGWKYYLYIAYDDCMNVDSSKYSKVISITAKRNEMYLLVAILDYEGVEPVLNETPDDKIYAKEILAHVSDTTNPHGRDLHQDKLTIHDSLKIKESTVYETIYGEYDFNGQAGTKIEITGKEIVFVSVMPMGSTYNTFWVELKDKCAIVYSANQIGGKFKAEIKVK